LRWSAEVRLGDDFVLNHGHGEFSTAYYNYSQVDGEVLTASSLPAQKYSFNLSGELQLFSDSFACLGEYTWTRIDADRNITYVPVHKGSLTLKYSGDRLNLEWGNLYQGQMFAFEDSGELIEPSVTGVLGLQFKTADSFYAYLRVENLYNNQMIMRWGYDEPGLTVLGGLRITDVNRPERADCCITPCAGVAADKRIVGGRSWFHD
jgi:hypothetical protein